MPRVDNSPEIPGLIPDYKTMRSRRVLQVAIVVGLVVRVALLASTGSLATKIVDEQHYAQIAENLVAGHGFGWGPGKLTSIRPPLFPGLVAAVWTMTGPGHLQIIRILNILVW